MDHKWTITGASAELRWSYYAAAALGPWTIVAEPKGTTVTAQVMNQDAYRCSQQPLAFVVPRANGHVWKWPVQSLQIAGGSLTATLGPQE